MNSQVLRPSEMDGITSNIDSIFQHAAEEYRAEKAVESTKSAMIWAQNAITDSRHSNLLSQEPRKWSGAVKSQLTRQ